MEKKIGVLTFHNSVNYGAVMQTYGLQQFLVNSGYDVEIVDYVNNKINSELNKKIPCSISNPRSVVKYIVKTIYRKRKASQFRSFNNKYLHLSAEKNLDVKNIKNATQRYDTLITGSDQVWNLNITGNDLSYYLDFAKADTTKISYAASVGDISSFDITPALEQLKKIDYISVREQSFLLFAKEKYGLDAELCCDPTILCSRDEFYAISEHKVCNSKYILCFLMEDKPEIKRFAEVLAKESGYKIISNKTSFEFFLHSAPEDFLSWIRNAEVVLTDSFHGTVFSLLFRKQFLSDMFDGKHRIKSRIEDLLNGIDLENQFQEISENRFEELMRILQSPIDYDVVDNKVNTLSTKSRDWLLMALEEK